MKRSLIALAFAAVLPLSAQASELSYTYIEGDYLNIDGDADGLGLRGAVNFADSDFYGFGSYQSVETHTGGFDVDGSELGVGYHYGLNDKLHLLAELAYVNVDTDFGNGDGYRTSVGLRGAFNDRIEGLLKANYVDGSDFDGDFSGTAGVQVKLNATWGITGEVEFADGDQSYLAGVRASF